MYFSVIRHIWTVVKEKPHPLSCGKSINILFSPRVKCYHISVWWTIYDSLIRTTEGKLEGLKEIQLSQCKAPDWFRMMSHLDWRSSQTNSDGSSGEQGELRVRRRGPTADGTFARLLTPLFWVKKCPWMPSVCSPGGSFFFTGPGSDMTKHKQERAANSRTKDLRLGMQGCTLHPSHCSL